MHIIERRFTSQVSLRGSANGNVITGYAAKFNSYSSDMGGWKEVIAPGAFTRALQSGDDVKCLRDHAPSLILGRTKNGSLSLAEDNVGLRFSCVLPDTSTGRDVRELISKRYVDSCSFAFAIDGADGESWDTDYDDPEDRSRKIPIRKLKRVKLFDVSVVTAPAYPNTSVSTDSMPVHVSSLQRSHEELFPHGVPVEIRNHVPGLRIEEAQQRRRRLTNLILGL